MHLSPVSVPASQPPAIPSTVRGCPNRKSASGGDAGCAAAPDLGALSEEPAALGSGASSSAMRGTNADRSREPGRGSDIYGHGGQALVSCYRSSIEQANSHAITNHTRCARLATS